jgi:hypothetical protein
MRKVLEYQKLADDCRKRAAHAANQSTKEALQRLAATWDLLATTRHKQIEKGLVEPVLEFGGRSIERDAVLPPHRHDRTVPTSIRP